LSESNGKKILGIISVTKWGFVSIPTQTNTKRTLRHDIFGNIQNGKTALLILGIGPYLKQGLERIGVFFPAMAPIEPKREIPGETLGHDDPDLRA